MRDESLIQSDEDVRLMLRVRTGDRQAYARLYEKYVPLVKGYLARRDGVSQSREDLAQEVFTRIWHRRSQYRPLAPLRNYLLGIAANVLNESRAKARRQASLDLASLETTADARRPPPPAQAQAAEQVLAVRALMLSLPTRQRQAVELVYLAGLPPDEAARRLGCSRKALQVHLTLARQRLKELARHSRSRTRR